MTSDPRAEMTDDERVLLEHRHAVRVNLPLDVRHAAELARRALGVAGYAAVDVPAEVTAAAEVVERWTAGVVAQVEGEEAERQRTGTDRASFQRDLERAQRDRRLAEQRGQAQGDAAPAEVTAAGGQPRPTPYAGAGADGALRSAQIDREEADTLVPDDARRAELLASAERWERQAAEPCPHRTASVVASIGDPGIDDDDARDLPWDQLPDRHNDLVGGVEQLLREYFREEGLDGIRAGVSLGICSGCHRPVVTLRMADDTRWTPEHGPAWSSPWTPLAHDGDDRGARPAGDHAEQAAARPAPAPGPLWVGGLRADRQGDREQERGWAR